MLAPQRPVDKAVTLISNAVVIFAGFSSLLVMLVNIFGRYFFNFGLVWAEEYSRYCFITIIYFGMPMAVKNDKMLKVEILANIFPKLKDFEEVVEIVSGLAVAVFLFMFGYQFTNFTRMFKERSVSMSWLPMWVVYAILPVGCVFLFYRYCQRGYILFQKNKESSKNESSDENGGEEAEA